MVKLRPTERKILPLKVTQQTGVTAKIRSLVLVSQSKALSTNANY